MKHIQRQSLSGLSIALVGLGFLTLAIPEINAATTFVTHVVFDDYSEPFDTTGLEGPSPLVLKAYPDPLPSSQTVSTLLASGQTAGATRYATLTHLDPAFVSGVAKGNSSAIIFDEKLGFGTDTRAPTRLTLAYDFSGLSAGAFDAGILDSDHIVFSVFDTDGGDNSVNAQIRIVDGQSNAFSADLLTLGVDVATVGDQHIPFTSFPGIDFGSLASLALTWENPGEAQFDGALAFIGTGKFASSPEPGFAFPLLALASFTLLRRRHS